MDSFHHSSINDSERRPSFEVDSGIDLFTKDYSPPIKKTIRQKASSIWKNVTVEPILFAYMFVYSAQNVVMQALLVERICLNTLHLLPDKCENLTSDKEHESMVEKYNSDLNLYMTIVETLPSVLVTALLGAWTDKYGRRTALVVIVLGFMLQQFGNLLIVYFPKAPPTYFLLPCVPKALTGGLVAAFVITLSHISSVSSVNKRTIRIAIAEGSMFAGLPLGSVVSGSVYKSVGYGYVFVVLIIVLGLTVVYIMVHMEDSVEVMATKQVRTITMIKDFFNCDNFRECVRASFRPRENSKRLYIFLLMLSAAAYIFPLAGEGNVAYLFTRTMFSWEPSSYSYYNAFRTLVSVSGAVITLPLMIKVFKWNDTTIGIIGAFASIVCATLMALAWQPWVLYLVSFISIFSNGVSIIIRSMMSKIVDTDELGKVFSLLASCESIIPMICGVMYTELYKATVDSFPGAVFVMSAAVMTIPIAVFVKIHLDKRKFLGFAEDLQQLSSEDSSTNDATFVQPIISNT